MIVKNWKQSKVNSITEILAGAWKQSNNEKGRKHGMKKNDKKKIIPPCEFGTKSRTLQNRPLRFPVIICSKSQNTSLGCYWDLWYRWKWKSIQNCNLFENGQKGDITEAGYSQKEIQIIMIKSKIDWKARKPSATNLERRFSVSDESLSHEISVPLLENHKSIFN